MRRVLVVDDEENLRVVLRAMLRKHRYEVEVAASAREGLDKLASFDPDFVLADVRMPGMTGLELCGEIKAQGSSAVVILMSAFGSVDLAIEAMKAGAYDYISKPFKHDEALLVLKKAEEREALRRENKALRETIRKSSSLGEMFGKSERMEQLFRTVQKVADYKTTVLIEGESGTGKELVARALHRGSSRKDRPFVAVNCGAIPAALLESELFGHKRGAFTDATSDKRGLFEEADGGTLFLDEIGELPLGLQVKLLRALQEGTIRRLGETRDVKVDVRVVAATLRDLSAEAKAGRFREDLFYRLNVLALKVPPLRDRKDDIPLLVTHFIEKNRARLGTRVTSIDQGAMRVLLDYHWPGNVRELENLIERAAVLAESETIGEAELPERVREPTDAATVALELGEISIKKTTRVIEEALIRRALERTKGNRTHAARILEISHRALLYKIKEYGIE